MATSFVELHCTLAFRSFAQKMETGGYSKIASRSETPIRSAGYSVVYNRVGFGAIKKEGGKLIDRSTIADLEASINRLKLSSDFQVVQRICQLLQHHGQDLEMQNKDKLSELFKTLKCMAGSKRVDVQSRLMLLKLFKQRASGWMQGTETQTNDCSEQRPIDHDHETTAPGNAGSSVYHLASQSESTTYPHCSLPQTQQLSTVNLTLSKQQAQTLIMKGKQALQDICTSSKVEISFHQEEKANKIMAALIGWSANIEEARRNLYLLIEEDKYDNLAAADHQDKFDDTETIQPQPIKGRRLSRQEPTSVPNLRITKNEDDSDIHVQHESVPGQNSRWKRTLRPRRISDSGITDPDSSGMTDINQNIDFCLETSTKATNKRVYSREFLLSCWHSCTTRTIPAEMLTVPDHEMFVSEMRWESNPFNILHMKDNWRDTGFSFTQSKRMFEEPDTP